MIIMVTGGRTFDDEERVAMALEPYAHVGNILLSGGADGADYLCELYWHMQQLPYIVMPAPWERTGRAAGPMRSQAQLVGNSIAPYAKLVPDVLVAFPGGKGTQGTIDFARTRGIKVERA